MSNYSNQRFEMAKGEDIILEFTPLIDVDITDYSLSFTFKKSTKLDSTAVDFTKTTASGITFVDESIGTLKVIINSSDTINLSTGVYIWELWRTDTSYRKKLAIGQCDLVNTIKKFS